MSASTSQYRAQYQQRVQPAPQIRRAGKSNTAAQTAAAAETARYEQRRQEIEAQRARIAEAELGRRKAAQPTDRTIPNGIEDLVIGDGLDQYQKLRSIERRLDSIMTRRKLDSQDPVSGGAALLGGGAPKMREIQIRISNTAENQPWQGGGLEESAFDFNMGVEATYRVRIEGVVVDNDDKADRESGEEGSGKNDTMEGVTSQAATEMQGVDKGTTKSASHRKAKMSHFFKGITVDFNRNKNYQPEGMTQVEWKRPTLPENSSTLPTSADFDTLEFERKSDENINCSINFYRDISPEKFLLDKPLAALVDAKEEERDSVIVAIWEYIKTKGLQQDDEKRSIHCDDMMKAVFGMDVIYFPHIPTLLEPHLFPLPPLSIPYTIRVDPEYHALPPSDRFTTYTLHVPDPTSTTPTSGTRSLKSVQLPDEKSRADQQQRLLNLRQYDQHIYLLIQALHNSRRRHTFFSQMSADPVAFTRRWMTSQKHDLKVLLGEDGRFADPADLSGAWMKGGENGIWGTQEVREAVQLMVEKPDRTGRGF